MTNAKEQAKFDRDDFEREMAVQAATDYFKAVKSEIDRMGREAERFYEKFNKILVNGDKHVSLIDVVMWHAHLVAQFNGSPSQAVRATEKLSKASVR